MNAELCIAQVFNGIPSLSASNASFILAGDHEPRSDFLTCLRHLNIKRQKLREKMDRVMGEDGHVEIHNEIYGNLTHMHKWSDI